MLPHLSTLHLWGIDRLVVLIAPFLRHFIPSGLSYNCKHFVTAPLGHLRAPDRCYSNDLQHTIGHVGCEACRASVGGAMEAATFAVLPFMAAAKVWLDSRQGIEESSRFNYTCHFKTLAKFFGGLTLSQIEIGHIEEYRNQRKAGTLPGHPRQCGPSIINHEVNALQQLMVRAGQWQRIADWYEPLPSPTETRRRALTPEEERRLFEAAASRPRWKVAYCCAVICANTTAGAGEIRGLTLGDIDLPRRTIRIVEGAKNQARVRTIPLNDDALWAVTELYVRAAEMGAHLNHHYLLPFKSWNRKGGVDVNKAAGGWRTAWRNLTIAAGTPNVGFHGLRHHVITKMLENPQIPERTVTDLAGHVSNRMLDTYSHTRMDALRNAVSRIDTGVTKCKNRVTIMKRRAGIPSLPANSPQQSSPTFAATSLPICFSASTLQPLLPLCGTNLPKKSWKDSSK